MRTPPLEANRKPFKFRSRQSEFRVGLGFTTPLDRRAQRNNFRASQIAYQQARRGYMAAEDQIKLDVRQAFQGRRSSRSSTALEGHRTPRNGRT